MGVEWCREQGVGFSRVQRFGFRGVAKEGFPQPANFFFFFITLGLELSDTKVYEP